jgi:hypothetical protein
VFGPCPDGYVDRMADKQERITDATKEADRRDAEASHGAPQVPTAAESEAAERHGEASPETGEHYEEMLERGANQQGEGRVP